MDKLGSSSDQKGFPIGSSDQHSVADMAANVAKDVDIVAVNGINDVAIN